MSCAAVPTGELPYAAESCAHAPTVKALPSRTIGAIPIFIRHDRMMRHPVIEVVFVEVGVHPGALLPQDLVVLGAGQRRKHEELEDIERQLSLPDRVFKIVGRAKPALAALNVDDCAERALVGASATEIQTRQLAGNPADLLARQDRCRLSLQ
jgi:hypothetical protein